MISRVKFELGTQKKGISIGNENLRGGVIVHYRGKFNLKRFFGGGLCTPALKFDPLVFGQCMTLSSRSRSRLISVNYREPRSR